MQAARTRTMEAGNSMNEKGEREGCAGDCVRRINDPEKVKHSKGAFKTVVYAAQSREWDESVVLGDRVDYVCGRAKTEIETEG